MISNAPFEGPEKKLFITFTPHTTTGLRTITPTGLDSILTAASCSVLSVTRNSHVDAYLLSESSLFISDSSFMIKTCGSTTLLHALPILLQFAASIGLYPVTVQYSRVQFYFPHRQPYPHDSYTNEVAYLDRVLQFQGRPFQLGTSNVDADWHVYVAQILPDLPHRVPQTLEIFMFDLDPKAMAHYLHHDKLQRSGTNPAVQQTTVRSGIAKLLKKGSEIDAYNFLPCGYSLNALSDDAYYTIHVSPEPDASYVSFETTVDTSDLASLVAAVINVFRPSRFTVSYLASSDTQALQQNPKAPVHWQTLSKLLSGQFSSTSDPALVRATNSIWATVATYVRHRDVNSLTCAPTSTELPTRRTNTALDILISQLDNALFVPSDDVLIRARSAIAHKPNVQRPTFIVDLTELHQRAMHVHNTLHPQFSLRYAVRCNSDPAVLTLLSLLGWSFEAVSIAEVDALHRAGVKRDNIVFASPLLTPGVLSRLHDVGIVSLFCLPDEKLKRVIKDAHVAVEVRVPVGNVEETVEICKHVLTFQCEIHSLALDCDPGVYLLGGDEVAEWLDEGLSTLRAVADKLPACTVANTIFSVGELFPGCRDNDFETFSKELTTACKQFGNICFDPGRWVVGHCTALLVSVIGRRVLNTAREDGEKSTLTCTERMGAIGRYNYYLNDGVYGAFSFVIMERSGQNKVENRVQTPQVIYSLAEKCREEAYSTVSSDDECIATSSLTDTQHDSTVFGPTCDALDRIWTGLLPKLEIGDMLLFRDMGAYAASAVSSFNGFAKKFDVVYVVGHDTALTSPHSSDTCSL